MIANKFGKLTVISPHGYYVSKAGRKKLWLCKCECGNKTICKTGSLNSGHVTSCGCLQGGPGITRNKAHGLTDTKEWLAWSNMIKRCDSPRYKNHHGRGILVCKKWRDSFVDFLADVGYAPSNKHSIDRKDNDGHYEPGNVKWSTPKEQRANQRRRQKYG